MAVSPIGIAGAGATIALAVKTAKIKTRNLPRRIAAAPNSAEMVPAIGAAVRPLAALEGASASGRVPVRSRAVTRVRPLLLPLAMATGVAALVRPPLLPLAMAVGVPVPVPPLVRSVRKNDARDRARGVACRPLALVRVLAGAQLRNEPRAHRNGAPLRKRRDDLLPAAREVVPPGVVRVEAAIGAPRHEDITHREQLTDMDILASAAALRMAGAVPLIAVPRTAEATASAIADPLTPRGTPQEVAVTDRISERRAIVGDSVLPATPIAVPHIGADMATDRISALADIVDTVMAPLMAVMAVDSVMAGTVLAATPRMAAAASAIPVMAEELSLITAAAVRLASAIRDTSTAATVDTLMQDPEAVDIPRTVVGATEPASIVGKVAAGSPMLITWFPRGDAASAGIAAKNVSCAGL